MAQAGWIISLATKTRLFKNRTNFTSLPQHCLFKPQIQSKCFSKCTINVVYVITTPRVDLASTLNLPNLSEV